MGVGNAGRNILYQDMEGQPSILNQTAANIPRSEHGVPCIVCGPCLKLFWRPFALFRFFKVVATLIKFMYFA